MLRPKNLSKDFNNYILSVRTDIHKDIELLGGLAYSMKCKKFMYM
jgi:hypothetical protein